MTKKTKQTTQDRLKAFHAAMDYISTGYGSEPERKCQTCGGKGYVEINVHADARYYSASPAAKRVVCWDCKR